MPSLLYTFDVALNKGTKGKADPWDWGSGGGIVAAALGATKLGIDDSICAFKGLVSKAFKKRTGVDIPILGKLIMAHHHGKYKTSGLEAVLKDTFGHGHLFGAPLNQGLIRNLKVGVIATSSNRQTFLLTNYNRPPPERKSGKTIDIGSNEDADEEDIDDADDCGDMMYDIARAPTGKETGERKSTLYPTGGTRNSGVSIIYDSHLVDIYAGLSEVGDREGSDRIPRQSIDADEWDGSSGDCEDGYSDIADSRRSCYCSG